jgi:hypothetical protein
MTGRKFGLFMVITVGKHSLKKCAIVLRHLKFKEVNTVKTKETTLKKAQM